MAKNPLMLDVLKKYQLRIDVFQVKADTIMNNIFEKYPELLEFRKKYAQMRMDARTAEDKGHCKSEYDNLYQQYESSLNKCLEKENVSASDLEYQPLCTLCNDTGYVGNVHKRYCTCVIAEAAQNMLEGSNINDHETIENFNLELFDDSTMENGNLTQKKQMEKLLNYMTSWTKSFPNCDRQQLLISGGVGLGKSYCLNSLAYEVIKQGFSAMMITSFAINEAAFDEIKKSDSGALNMMRSVDLLLIDDLGSEQVLNNITCPTLFNVLNERVRRSRHTIISTNLSAEEIEERYGSRVFSRLIDKNRTMILPLMGKDIRSKV
ncbi:MAG: ATP-binding protein [Clostridiales bacterium]|nr:ATP-binding protein [Clostridiales bacterium]